MNSNDVEMQCLFESNKVALNIIHPKVYNYSQTL
jgi:hypothetical protein